MIATINRERQRREVNGEQGFTLIELLIVIIVLGILAAIVVFALGSVTGQSAVAACNADAKTVSVAVSAYQAENPGAVPTFTDLLATAKGGPYLKTQPNSSYYDVTLLADVVQIALKSSDPGATWTTGPTPAAIGVTAQNYEGSSIFTWSNAGGGTVPATNNGQNICAGA